MTIGILEPKDFSPEAMRLLSPLGPVEFYDGSETIADFIADKSALFVRLGHRIDRNLMSAGRYLKAIVSPTTALNHIDLHAAQLAGISVLSLRGETDFLRSITATPEHALGLVIATLRNYRHAFLGAGSVAWNRDVLRGSSVAGMPIGIIGFGRVGTWLARHLAAMDAEVMYEDCATGTTALPNVRRMHCKEDLIEASQVIILAASYTNGQPAILTAPLLRLMQGKHLVNVARGELIDEGALIQLIGEGHFAGVALDVIEDELSQSNRVDVFRELSTRFNLIVTPHIGGATLQAMQATEIFMARKLVEHVSASS